MDLDQKKVKKYIELWRKKQKHEDEIDDIKEKLSELEAELLPVFKESVQKTNIRGKGTVFLERRVNASCGGDVPAVVAAAKKAKGRDGESLEWLVKDTVNASSLGGWVREFDPKGKKRLSPDQFREEVRKVAGDEFADAINITETFKLKVTKT